MKKTLFALIPFVGTLLYVFGQYIALWLTGDMYFSATFGLELFIYAVLGALYIFILYIEHRKYVLPAVFGFIVGIALLFIIGFVLSFIYDMCGNQSIASVVSPDKTKEVVIFQRDCGATTDFSTQGSIFPAARKIKDNDSGNLFIADTDHGAAQKQYSIGGPLITAEWVDNNHVDIKYATGSRFFLQKDSVDGVEVTYEGVVFN